jgi:hypothetical protein
MRGPWQARPEFARRVLEFVDLNARGRANSYGVMTTLS